MEQNNSTGASWLLAVTNGGQLPGAGLDVEPFFALTADLPDGFDRPREAVNRGQWRFATPDGQSSQRVGTIGVEGAQPVVGDFDGDGAIEIGLFADGQWFLDLNDNGAWDDSDLWIQLGGAGDQPLIGDWDGDGKDDVGIRSSAADEQNAPADESIANSTRELLYPVRLFKRTSEGRLRGDPSTAVFQLGSEDGIAVSGDFNGNGEDSVGVFSEGQWSLDANGDGRFSADEATFEFGQAGDTPVVGDFNGDGIDEVGIFRDGVWRLDVDGDRVLTERDTIIEFGQPGDLPVVGDWNDDGIDEVGVYERVFVAE